jgi:hypothetical protein
MDDVHWFAHVNLKCGAEGSMELLRRPVAPCVVPLDEDELRSYHRLRINLPENEHGNRVETHSSRETQV